MRFLCKKIKKNSLPKKKMAKNNIITMKMTKKKNRTKKITLKRVKKDKLKTKSSTITGRPRAVVKAACRAAMPMLGTFLSSVWGLGFVGWMDFNLDPLILVVPVLISARTASYCVQLMERYYDEIRVGAEQEAAVRVSVQQSAITGSTEPLLAEVILERVREAAR